MSIKKNGCEFDRDANSQITAIKCLNEFTTNKQTFHYFVSTTLEMCIAGHGSVVTSHLDGTLVSKADVVASGSSLGDTIFEILCSIEFRAVMDETKK